MSVKKQSWFDWFKSEAIRFRWSFEAKWWAMKIAKHAKDRERIKPYFHNLLRCTLRMDECRRPPTTD